MATYLTEYFLLFSFSFFFSQREGYCVCGLFSGSCVCLLACLTHRQQSPSEQLSFARQQFSHLSFCVFSVYQHQ